MTYLEFIRKSQKSIRSHDDILLKFILNNSKRYLKIDTSSKKLGVILNFYTHLFKSTFKIVRMYKFYNPLPFKYAPMS